MGRFAQLVVSIDPSKILDVGVRSDGGRPREGTMPWLTLGSLAARWGTALPFTRVGLHDVPAATLVAARIAGAFLWLRSVADRARG